MFNDTPDNPPPSLAFESPELGVSGLAGPLLRRGAKKWLRGLALTLVLSGMMAIPVPAVSVPSNPAIKPIGVVVSVAGSRVSAPQARVNALSLVGRQASAVWCPIILRHLLLNGVVAVSIQLPVGSVADEGVKADIQVTPAVGELLGLKPGQSARMVAELPVCL